MRNDDITLYHMNYSRSTTVLWMLEELGVPYKVQLIPREPDQRDSGFLDINPMGKVPTLRHNGHIITESAAICLYLAESFPSAGLHVEVGDSRRGDYLKWLFFAPSCIEPAVLDRMFDRPEVPSRSAGWGNFDLIIQVISKALSRGPYILGDQFTTADVVIGSELGWGVAVQKVPETPEIKRYLSLLRTRQAQIHTFDMEKHQTWPVAAARPDSDR